MPRGGAGVLAGFGRKHRTWVFVIFSHETRSSPVRRNLMSEYPNLSISLIRPSIRRVVQKKSEQLASEGRFREKLRFSVVRAACGGRRESWDINDSGLPTISDNPRGILINFQIALLREILRLFSQYFSGNGILLEFFTFRRWGGRLGATPTEYWSATRLAAAKQNSPQPDAAPGQEQVPSWICCAMAISVSPAAYSSSPD